MCRETGPLYIVDGDYESGGKSGNVLTTVKRAYPLM